MKKGLEKLILPVLFFSALWGLSEAAFGGYLYGRGVSYSSVYLTIIAFVILSVARFYLPQIGAATAIGALAMLYKFFNSPFYSCHMLGILLTGVSYDLFFSVLKMKNRSLCAVVAVYLSYALFAIMITYVFRYSFWAQAGITKVLRHIGISGSLAAIGCAFIVPLSFRFGKWLKAKYAVPFELSLRLVPGSVSFIAAGIWIFGISVYLIGF
jgi:hypothetical protein